MMTLAALHLWCTLKDVRRGKGQHLSTVYGLGTMETVVRFEIIDKHLKLILMNASQFKLFTVNLRRKHADEVVLNFEFDSLGDTVDLLLRVTDQERLMHDPLHSH